VGQFESVEQKNRLRALAPSCLRSLLCGFASFFWSHTFGSCLATLEPTLASQGNSGRVLTIVYGRFFFGRDLARGFGHELSRKFVQIS